MTIPVLVLAAVFAVPPQDVPSTSAPLTSPSALTATFDAQRTQPVDPRTPTERPHQIGVGAQMAASNRGVGGGMRYFLGERVGVNFSASWYPNRARYTSGTPQGSTFAVLPSFILMLTKADKTRDVDIRPYVGGGLNYVRSTSPVTTLTTGSQGLQRRSGTGGQAFAGAEITFREADMVTISVEGIYYSLPVSYVNSSVVGGFNYLLAFHFYLR